MLKYYLLTVLILVVAIVLCFVGFGREYLIAVGLLTFMVWGWDKYRAVRQARRVPEFFLLGLAAWGGSPGAIAGQLIFNHKTRKRFFMVKLYGIAIIQAGALTVFVLR